MKRSCFVKSELQRIRVRLERRSPLVAEVDKSVTSSSRGSTEKNRIRLSSGWR